MSLNYFASKLWNSDPDGKCGMSEFKTTELNINVSSNFTDLFLCNCAFKKSLHRTSSKQLLKVHFLLKMLGWSNDLKNSKLEFFPLHVRIVLWCQIIRIMILSATMLRQHIIESLNDKFFLLRCCDTTMVLRLLISLEQHFLLIRCHECLIHKNNFHARRFSYLKLAAIYK